MVGDSNAGGMADDAARSRAAIAAGTRRTKRYMSSICARYHRIRPGKTSMSLKYFTKTGAGEGNRTLVFSLEGCCSTIELHPRRFRYAKSGRAWQWAICARGRRASARGRFLVWTMAFSRAAPAVGLTRRGGISHLTAGEEQTNPSARLPRAFPRRSRARMQGSWPNPNSAPSANVNLVASNSSI